MYNPTTKSLIDRVLSFISILLLLPIFIVLAFITYWKIGSPIFFSQKRPGIYGKPFTMWKFRTMTNATDAEGKLLPDAERLTGFGRFLRSSSLDELPELINVLKGDMSLVGPRPLLMQYLELYTLEQARRHHVKPGITGWAQINGRNAISWEERFKLDVWYVDNFSFWLDIKILWLTSWKVLKREGISQDGEATMSEFIGTGAYSSQNSKELEP